MEDMTMLHHKRKDCRLCGSNSLETAVPLSPQSFLTPDMLPTPEAASALNISEKLAKISLNYCTMCGNIQQESFFSALLRDKDGSIKRKNSISSCEYMENLAFIIANKYKSLLGGLAVDLSSFDGTFLCALRRQGFLPLGIEPLKEYAERSPIPALSVDFTPNTAKMIRYRYGSAKLITAITMSSGPHWCHPANLNDLDEYAEALRILLESDGVFFFETQYAVDMVEQCLIDTIQHDHLTYFLATPLVTWFDRQGFEVIDIENIEIKGGSLRIAVQKNGGPRPVSQRVEEIINKEKFIKAVSKEFFSALYHDIEIKRKTLLDEIKSRGDKYPIYGYGASAGTDSFLSQFKLSGHIKCIFDDSIEKIGLSYGIGGKIPVYHSEAIYDMPPGLIIIFSWRYAEKILLRHEAYQKRGGEFLIPLPQVSILR